MSPDHTARSDRNGQELSTATWWVPVIQYQDDLAFEIGQVAIRSAECEMHVREVLVSLAGDHDRSWILFEGQSLSTMIDNIKSMLSMDHEELWSEARQAVDEIKQLSEHRNAVVHGTWLPAGEWDEEDLGRPDPRPWGDDDDDAPIFLCTRSRNRKYGRPAKWTAADIEVLAEMMERATEWLMSAYARFYREEFPEKFERSGWKIWLHDNVGPGEASDPAGPAPIRCRR
jgi:hypothetical protein